MLIKILLAIGFVLTFLSCNQSINKNSLVSKNEDVLADTTKNIENQDSYVLSKLWEQSDFRNKKQYRFRSLEDAYKAPDSVINLAVYSGFNGAIPDNIDTFKNVQLIGMNNNNLTSLPQSIGNLLYLQEIHMNKNSFVEFPVEITNNRYLKTILLSDNKIENIPTEIQNLTYLENLVLNDNNIKVLSFGIFELPKLKVLGLRNNGIGELPDKFDQLSQLEKLNLQNNNIKELPETLINSSLKQINLRGNPMSSAYVEELRKRMQGTEIEF